MEKSNKKALIIDSSGVHPWLFAINEKDISADKLGVFLDDLGVDCYLSDQARHEFSTLNYTSGISLFAEPIGSTTLKKYDAVYLSDAGYFSPTANTNFDLQLSIPDFRMDVSNPTLWETSPQWAHLSYEDRSVIKTATALVSQYSSVAILTNDWSLRQQSNLYEGIEARGTCSMLASLSLGGYISYQRGTYIFGKWMAKESRWVPTVYPPERRKFTFREVLEVERKRREKSRSFWLTS
ncbi:MAG: hypothetical protein HYR95_01875 [Candidatus Colwellbacteria bacterium]|nr:hypothetical protein [Candidatus Colwellbacteria bacterium]MBI3273891.1 hypothetical protein [Candidatus Colwellbacteria bacterium]